MECSTEAPTGSQVTAGLRCRGAASLRRTGNRARTRGGAAPPSSAGAGLSAAQNDSAPPLTLVLKRTAAADREARGRQARGRVWPSADSSALRAQEDWTAAGCVSGSEAAGLFSDQLTAAESALSALADAVATQPAWLECHLDRMLRLAAVRLRSSKSTTVGAALALLQGELA